MSEEKVLVVYYSRTGTTRKVAEAIAELLGCELEEIIDTVDRSGAWGYLASGRDALKKRAAEIKAPQRDPGDYDLVVLGTPVWAWTMSSPMRGYLSQYAGRLPEVAFFCTTGGTGVKRTFRHMEAACGKPPRAVLGLRMKDVLKDRHTERLAQFAEELGSAGEAA